jgi:excisionase family DNA binding protein
MNRKSSYPSSSPTPLPSIPGQGADQFSAFAAEKLFSLSEVASYLRVEKRTAAKFITDESRTNRLKALWVGRSWLVSESDLRSRSFVDAQKSE